MWPWLSQLARGWRSALLAGLLIGLTGVLSFHWVCDLLYRCGCRPLWSSEHCNIHVADVPHCPWCSGGDGRFALVLLLTLLPALLVGGAVAAWGRRSGPGYLTGVGVFGVCAALLGWYWS